MRQLTLTFLIVLIPIMVIAQTAEDYLDKGVAKHEKGDHRAAIQDYNKAIELDPNLALVYYIRGFAKNGLGDQRGAIQDYNKAIELNPNYALAYRNRGSAKIDCQAPKNRSTF